MRRPPRCVFIVCARLVLTEIRLCAGCSCHEILKVSIAARAGWLRRLSFCLLFSGVVFVFGEAYG
jgi:hypothetical protein